METKDNDERGTVVNIFSNHFNAHALIPDNNGDCAREMYPWCGHIYGRTGINQTNGSYGHDLRTSKRSLC
jgi:hypothetical protein